VVAALDLGTRKVTQWTGCDLRVDPRVDPRVVICEAVFSSHHIASTVGLILFYLHDSIRGKIFSK